MRKKELCKQFLQFEDIYRKRHPRTAGMDIAIIPKLSEGKGAAQVAMEVPCAEATVYRALKRTERFLLEETKACADASLLFPC